MRGLVIALCLVAPVTAVSAGDRCAGEAPSMKPVLAQESGISILIPESWQPVVEQFSDGLTITDEAGECRLEIVRCPDLLDPQHAASLYERLYLGKNGISKECAEEVSAKLEWAGEAVAGEYSQRDWGRRVQAVFARADKDIVAALLKCPRSDSPPDWTEATAIFASYRRLWKRP